MGVYGCIAIIMLFGFIVAVYIYIICRFGVTMWLTQCVL